MKKLYKDQTGAALVVEAVVLYPLVILCLFFLVYMGLIIVQSSVLNATAQKTALLASREVAYPGYLSMIKNQDGSDAFSNSAIEMKSAGIVNMTYEPDEIKIEAYRYWGKDPLSESAKQIIQTMICNPKSGIVKAQSLLNMGKIEARVSCSNYAVTQFVTVTIEQEIMDIGVFRYFGIENPKLTAIAVASVNDSDEFVRDVDLIIDAAKWLGDKLGLGKNISKLRSKIKSAIDKIGLNK